MFEWYYKWQNKKAKEAATKQFEEKMQRKAKKDSTQSMHDVLKKTHRLPNNYKAIDNHANHPVCDGYAGDESIVYGWCHHNILSPENCVKKDMSAINKPDSCWDCKHSYIMKMCASDGSLSVVKRVNQKHTLNCGKTIKLGR